MDKSFSHSQFYILANWYKTAIAESSTGVIQGIYSNKNCIENNSAVIILVCTYSKILTILGWDHSHTSVSLDSFLYRPFLFAFPG